MTRAFVTSSLLIIFVLIMNVYWLGFNDLDWKHYILKWTDGKQHYIEGRIFISDFCEQIQLLTMFLIMIFGERRRMLWGYNMWFGYVAYSLWCMVDLWFWQNQTDAIYTLQLSLILMILEVVYLTKKAFKYKEDV